MEVLSLFSGAGFLDLGFMLEDFAISEAIEIEPMFIKAYNSGLGAYFKSQERESSPSKVKFDPIQGPIDASSHLEHLRLAAAHSGITGIIGGPPCQDFSIGGKNAGIDGKRGMLINSYLEIVKLVQPKFLFFENVPGLFNTKRHRESLDAFVDNLGSIGYVVWSDVLNVLSYGYPQDRPRLTIVAFRKEIMEKLQSFGYLVSPTTYKEMDLDDEKLAFRWPKRVFENPKSMAWPTKTPFGTKGKRKPASLPEALCVGSAILGISPKMPNQDEHFIPYSARFGTIDEGDTNRKSFKRLHRFRYSPTVAYGNNEVHLHPIECRRLTVREAMRLQTVPDEYVFPKEIPLTAKFKMISNGVPTAKARLIAKEIKRTYELYERVCEVGG